MDTLLTRENLRGILSGEVFNVRLTPSLNTLVSSYIIYRVWRVIGDLVLSRDHKLPPTSSCMFAQKFTQMWSILSLILKKKPIYRLIITNRRSVLVQSRWILYVIYSRFVGCLWLLKVYKKLPINTIEAPDASCIFHPFPNHQTLKQRLNAFLAVSAIFVETEDTCCEFVDAR